MVKRLSDYSRRKELKDARNGFTDPASGEVVDIVAARKLESEFPKPWRLFREELEARLSQVPSEGLMLLDHYTPEQAAAVEPIRVSRPVRRRSTGQAHKETIYSFRSDEKGYVTDRKKLVELKVKDLPNIIGYDDPRNKPLIDAIETRLLMHGDDGKKAFEDPLYKPSANGNPGPIVRSVKVARKLPSPIPIRKGAAENGSILRTDVFEKNGGFYLVPVYVHHCAKGVLPMKASTVGKMEDDWDVIDDTFEFMFSLYPNDWVVIKKRNEVVSGYYSSMNRAIAQLEISSHDMNGSKFHGVKTARDLTKYHVDILGRIFPVSNEIRKPPSKEFE
jgi:CRISPR-associated endonuclease Csn1